MISEKNILQTDFEGKKPCKEIYGFACRGKNSITRVLEETDILHKPNHQYPPSPLKSQMVGPRPLAMEHRANCNATVFLERCSFNCYACSAVWTIDCIKRSV